LHTIIEQKDKYQGSHKRTCTSPSLLFCPEKEMRNRK
jgi:hypothetical protein